MSSATSVKLATAEMLSKVGKQLASNSMDANNNRDASISRDPETAGTLTITRMIVSAGMPATAGTP
jgi:hypothetical protein